MDVAALRLTTKSCIALALLAALGEGSVIRLKLLKTLVPGEGIEPPTNGLQNRCSTAELTRHAAGSVVA